MAQKIRQFCRMGGFFLLVELHWEGSAPDEVLISLYFSPAIHFVPLPGGSEFSQYVLLILSDVT